MGKTLSTRGGRGSNNNKKKTNSKFSVYDFDDEQKSVEKHSLEILNKFNSSSFTTTSTPNIHSHSQSQSPLDKYVFLQHFSKESKDQDKKSVHEPIHIDATEEDVKGCASSLEVNAVSSSSDCYSNESRSNNHSYRCRLPNLDSYTSRGPDIVDNSTTGNRQVDTQFNFPSDSQLVGITSDDDDSVELNSASRFNCHHVDDEALSAERVRIYGFDGGEYVTDRAIVFSPVNIYIGGKIFWNPELTLTRNHVKLEVEGSVLFSDPVTCEWTVADILSIESAWCEKLSHVGLLLHLRSKDTKSAINVEDSGIVELDWEVTYAHWPELQNKIWALDSKYKDTWVTDSHVDAVNICDVLTDKFSSHHFRDSDEFVVTYPKGDLDAVSIGWSDIQLLRPRTFINDTIIDFYMIYLKNKFKHKEVPRFHFFNCFFFQKLVDLDGDLSTEDDGREAFLRVHKWTRKINLFEKDYIFIPVNFSFHWSLIVICHPAELANLKDEEMKKLANLEEKDMQELCKVPCILHMDSIKGSHRGLQKPFRGYLLEEWKERHNDLVVDISSRFWNVPFFGFEVPQQENLFDCGLFLLHYVELFMGEAPENFNPFRIPSSSSFLKEHWFSPAEASSKRAHIKDLIYRISRDHYCDVGASDKRSPSESTEDDECNNSGHFVNEFCTSTNTYQVNHSNCTAHQKFGTKAVVEAPHILQCVGEPNLNNDEILDSRYNTRSPSDRCHPARQYNQSRSVMSPIEEHEESEEQKLAMSYCDKELNATESKLLSGISIDIQEVEKQDNLHVCGDPKSAVLDLDVVDSDEIEIFATSDDFAACVVEDSKEICETQDDDECQSSGNHQNKTASFNQVVNSIATTSLPSEHMLNDCLGHCGVSASEEKQLKTPRIKDGFGYPYQQGVIRVLSNQDSNLIEITDSVERHTPLIPDTQERMSAKRPRRMLLEEEEPLHKRFQTIVID